MPVLLDMDPFILSNIEESPSPVLISIPAVSAETAEPEVNVLLILLAPQTDLLTMK